MMSGEANVSDVPNHERNKVFSIVDKNTDLRDVLGVDEYQNIRYKRCKYGRFHPSGIILCLTIVLNSTSSYTVNYKRFNYVL